MLLNVDSSLFKSKKGMLISSSKFIAWLPSHDKMKFPRKILNFPYKLTVSLTLSKPHKLKLVCT